MNTLAFSGFCKRMRHRLLLHARLLDVKTKASCFSIASSRNTIQRIYVINLDRQPERWRKMKRELNRIRVRSGEPLSSITRRFSAIDARYFKKRLDPNVLKPYYSLADQLSVEPSPLVPIDAKARNQRIEMSSQEIAVSLSHIEVWKLIVAGSVPYVLVLEDDVYFRYGFAKSIDTVWHNLALHISKNTRPDLLYLSFEEVKAHGSQRKRRAKILCKPDCGIWNASGYILSRVGAQRLLSLLPVCGPVDLWLNLQFKKLNVLISQKPLVEQRIDVPSTNFYSIMPVLSQFGIHTHAKPLVPRLRKYPGPVFAYGKPGSGLTALATALSMLGYTCCSDIRRLQRQEYTNLLAKTGKLHFNAYVNIGSLDNRLLTQMAQIYPNAKFISTTLNSVSPKPGESNQILQLPPNHKDKWAILSKFLKHEYPAFAYPQSKDLGQRNSVSKKNFNNEILPSKNLKFDTLPWIIKSKKWSGIVLDEARTQRNPKHQKTQQNDYMDNVQWQLRDDTFPSNLAVFVPKNTEISESGDVTLTFCAQDHAVRSFASGAIVTQKSFLYGRFSAEIKPSNVSGLITGVFLHRNSPRQEIDIEFLGKDTTKMLVNVFYNPGVEGTKLEYGYRGTPILIELGFDAATSFHKYEIEWQPNAIRWLVDNKIVHERVLWDPTPIPNLSMTFNINLWHSRPARLAGNLDASKIPAKTSAKSIQTML